MKKITSVLMMLMALFITSCSNDDDVKNVAAEVAGNYDGYTVAECKYFNNSVSADQTLSMTAKSADKVTVKYTSSTWGEFTIDEATVQETSKGYTLSGSGKSVMGHAGSESKEYDCTVAGTVEGGVANIVFTCPSVMGGLSITFSQGDVPAEIVLPGSYTGYTLASSKYFTGTVAKDETINLTQNSDGTFSVAYTSATWGEFTISNVKAEYSNGAFTLSGEGSTMMGMNGSVKEYACTLAGSVDVAKSTPSFVFTIPTVMGGMTIQFYPGEYNE